MEMIDFWNVAISMPLFLVSLIIAFITDYPQESKEGEGT